MTLITFYLYSFLALSLFIAYTLGRFRSRHQDSKVDQALRDSTRRLERLQDEFLPRIPRLSSPHRKTPPRDPPILRV